MVGAQIAFGLFPIFGTVAFAPGGLTPLGVGTWRIAAGALALGALSFALQGRAGLPERADLPRFSVCAVLGVVVNQGLFLLGLALSTPMNAGLVMSLIPVFTFAIAVLARQEQLSLLRLGGILIGLGGAALLLIGRGGSLLSGHGLGNALMVINALSFSAYLVVSRPLVLRYPSLSVIAWVYILATPFLPLFALGQKLVPDPGATAAWLSLAYIVVFPTVVAYLLNMFALARLRASTTAVYVYMQPLITGIAAWLVFAETPTLRMVWAAVLLFVGIWLVAGGRKRPIKRAG